MSAHQSTQWFWSDWLGDQEVRRLTLAERGLWIDLLALAAAGSPAGYVCDGRGEPISNEDIARLTNATPKEVAKLINGIVEKGVGSRDRTGRLFNRRMVRQAEMTAKKKRAGKLGGDQTKLKWLSFQSNATVLPRHVPEQVPRQMLEHREPPLTNPINLNSSSVPVAAREKGSTGGEVVKLPAQATKADLDAIYETRRRALPRLELNKTTEL